MIPAGLLLLALSARADLVAAGDSAFSRRDDPARLAQALEAYGQAAAAAPGDPAAELRLARALAFRALSEPAAAEGAWPAAARAAERALRRLAPAFAEAVDAGREPAEAAARVEAPGAEALYLLALSTWSSAQQKGVAALLAVKDAALPLMERAAALDERVDFGGPQRALGAWRASLPGPAGGGVAAARAHFERARAVAPGYLLNRVREAETLCVLLQDRARFEALLEEVLAADEAALPEAAPENRLAKRLAGALRARAGRLF
ncbi:MAG TPA: TRAP transporter TatT component family protein [Anaeromyxobacteraceae bacterium]